MAQMLHYIYLLSNVFEFMRVFVHLELFIYLDCHQLLGSSFRWLRFILLLALNFLFILSGCLYQ